MSNQVSLSQNLRSNWPVWAGCLFLVLYWWFGFDGITFSDDVYYILAGKNFWEGNMQVDDYHFSSRWGAYVPFGFFGLLFGFGPHIFSLFSLSCYLLSFLLLARLLEKKQLPLFAIWFCTQVYFLHFISKVYPDSALILWVSLVPVFAVHRHKRPILAGIGLILALFLGFITKETIIFLAPFPILLFFFDLRSKLVSSQFYTSLVISGFLIGTLYLGYFWIEFGDPLYRIQSINEGHYISEFTYADKGIGSILKRLTILPFTTFVERAYWPWIIFAIPCSYMAWKNKGKVKTEFALAGICLLVGFWFMSSTLEIYNPIYLNPRHLIILIPILSVLIVFGWQVWQSSKKWKYGLSAAILIGVMIAIILKDWKMAAFHVAFIPIVWLPKPKIKFAFLALLLITPTILAIPYQKNLKGYSDLLSTLDEITQPKENQNFVITNNFLVFSQEVILPGKEKQQDILFPIEDIIKLQRFPPQEVEVLIYNYYLHAYPKEKVDVDRLETWIFMNEYEVIEEWKENQLWYRKLSRVRD
ncbi:hypothetical protein [Algoriphagus sediminis]|uniref:Glycosyltransferase RgtA/B/C/D-like domain-containing protein n=1 Tax=Algoriphagus sediminis TaxID=3057113 RepID=A0ABT7YDG0_9BACT|nr:hypothetical protein [Algoriphagus sediminis]MDN3204563.1 hypothetical protein [Algoriphagus sediminis]